jgi:hypothetical protein
MTRQARAEPAAEKLRSKALNLGLSSVTTSEAYTRLLLALDEGKVSVREAEQIATVLFKGITIRDAEVYRVRLAAAEAKALEAARLAGRALGPASKRTVDVTPEGDA